MVVSGLYRSKPLRMVSIFSGLSSAKSKARPIVARVTCVGTRFDVVDEVVVQLKESRNSWPIKMVLGVGSHCSLALFRDSSSYSNR